MLARGVARCERAAAGGGSGLSGRPRLGRATAQASASSPPAPHMVLPADDDSYNRQRVAGELGTQPLLVVTQPLLVMWSQPLLVVWSQQRQEATGATNAAASPAATPTTHHQQQQPHAAAWPAFFPMVVCPSSPPPPPHTHPHTHTQVVVVLSGSMEPGFYRGDILFLYQPHAPLQAGDIVVFNTDGREIPIVHRVIKVGWGGRCWGGV